MSNFAFLPAQFRTIAEAATQAESHIQRDPRAACFHARFALESVVLWLYRYERSLSRPYDQNLGALLHEPSLQNLLPQAVFQKARLIHKIGNRAVHEPRPVKPQDALQAVKDLQHLCYWLVRTYTPSSAQIAVTWDDQQIPPALDHSQVVPRSALEALEKQLAEQNEALLRQQQERDKLDAEFQALQQQLAQARATAQQIPDTHDYSEADTRRYLIDTELNRVGWKLDQPQDREYEVQGMPTKQGKGYADYVLWGDDGKPLAVIEAKKTTLDPAQGQQQAKLYADCLEAMHGQRPIIFYTNGYTTWLWDDTAYPPRQVAGFYAKADLTRLLLRRQQRQPLDIAQIRDAISGRYYQKRVIGSIFQQFTSARRKALLVMATGTGKTRTAISLVDVLQRAGWVKRALFLADRISLVNQACKAFKAHLPESSPVNLVTEKNTDGRVYVCTYPSMMGLSDSTEGNEARFSVGYFDLIIIDEAHRSVYQKYGEIFRYFDALLVGLTATPREEVDKNTYDLFELESGVPTDAYELEQAVKDGFLVPPRVAQVDLKFPRDGIHYDNLTEAEKAQWESLDWGDETPADAVPQQVNASAINSWLFNKSTVDLVLQHLMEHGHKVEGGDRLAKTIIFARNHDHAKFIEERFNHHYPHYAGHFARVIDNREKYAQSLIEDFSIPHKVPHIAISVDMMDTGIDVPEVANLVFFKPVYSKIKFWQMIGRGTRLCPDLFGPGEDKQDFRVFDFCFNFDFFREKPEGIKSSNSIPLGTRLFQARVDLLGQLQRHSGLVPEPTLTQSLGDTLHQEVSAMNRENFLVRMRLEALDPFQRREAWEHLSSSDQTTLKREVAGLPSELESEKIESRLLDLTIIQMQLAQLTGDSPRLERRRQQVVEIARLLEEQSSIPLIRAQLEFIASVQEDSFWEDINLDQLEEIRLRLRQLVPHLKKKNRQIVYTDFKDEVLGVREETAVPIPKMTGLQYEKKVKDYLRNHLNHLVIHRLRTNQLLTTLDLQGLETTLAELGEDDGESLLSGLLARSGAPSLAHFIRSMVGMDRSAAHAAFAQFLDDRSLTPPQIRFIEMVIDQLTARGVMEASALYEPPFSNLHAGGPDELFAGRETVIDAMFSTLASLERVIN